MAIIKKLNSFSATSRLFDFRDPDVRLRWIKVGIILAVLALSAGVGLMTSTEKKQTAAILLMAALVAFVVVFFLAERLSWGVVLLMITAAYTPFSLPTGTESRIVDSLLVTALFMGLWVLRMFVVERRFHLVPSRVNLPLLGFMVVTVISLGWSMVFRDPGLNIWKTFPLVQVASTVVMVLLPGAFLFVANHADEKILKIITVLMLAAGVIGLVSNFLRRVTVDTGGLMSMWVMSISLALAFFHPKLGLPLRAGLLALVGGWVIWGFVLNISWVAGWLPGLLAIGIVTFMRSRKLFFTIVAIMLVVAFVFRDYYISRYNEEKRISGVTRVGAWEVNWRITGQHLLFGTGPGGYAAYYMTYFPYEGLATHNNYIDVVAQTGLIGMGFYLWAWGAILWQGWRITRRLRGRRGYLEAMANAGFAGAIASMVIMAFGDWLLPFAYTQTIAGFDYAVFSWIFLGALVAIEQIVNRQEAAAAHA